MTIPEIPRANKTVYADIFLQEYIDGQRLLQFNKDEIGTFIMDSDHAEIILRHIEVLKNMAPEQLRSIFGTRETRMSERICQTSITFTRRPFGFFIDDRHCELIVGDEIIP